MKILSRKNLKEELKFDMYYTNSLNFAFLTPHQVHILTEDIVLDGFVITEQYVLFYNQSGDDLQIISPNEWKHMTYVKANLESHQDFMKNK